MTDKERRRLMRLNAVINSIDRITSFEPNRLRQEAIDDLKWFRECLDQERQNLLKKIN
jgi:hypothetical protein